MRFMSVFLTAAIAQLVPAAEPITVNVGIFPYVPDIDAVISRLTTGFEKVSKGKSINVIPIDPDEIHLRGQEWYTRGADKKEKSLAELDVVEIDLCRFDELKSAIDPIPYDLGMPNTSYVGPARTTFDSRPELGTLALPHFVRGDFLVTWSSDPMLSKLSSLPDLKSAIRGDKASALYLDYFGELTLGEYYADAVLDFRGLPAAQAHFQKLAKLEDAEVSGAMDAEARQAVLSLFEEIRPDDRPRVKETHAAGGIELPKQFADAPQTGNAFLGYSERLYYMAIELKQKKPGSWSNQAFADSLSIRPMSFSGGASNGTPTWVNAFVVPKGKAEKKTRAIAEFMAFTVSHEGYAAYSQPDPSKSPSYMLPAVRTELEKQQSSIAPALKKYAAALDAHWPIIDGEEYKGLRAAGAVLKAEVGALSKAARP